MDPMGHNDLQLQPLVCFHFTDVVLFSFSFSRFLGAWQWHEWVDFLGGTKIIHFRILGLRDHWDSRCKHTEFMFGMHILYLYLSVYHVFVLLIYCTHLIMYPMLHVVVHPK